ncbi:hypothetical protein TTHERM_000310579 (macronuclear) [Tetrahymena thermophila SB210]|uniref:Uncharacterized protein n=1 Tax=Tetrahymena thermophila (strain SB210) TaxID=312017 RepID=W7XIB8_TETTS|nr:hypothetical protein TTHERM_000310579 [Tetrahymena thermophila SB210]EWS73159.1 hypothetical protein TTHERM_000310579 [Tetrahymena thermophila SB210]|eukprot:XP_012654346.1 hypothetical protein TTHERM_000310579 [Tetrahymena thermophila SB210]
MKCNWKTYYYLQTNSLGYNSLKVTFFLLNHHQHSKNNHFNDKIHYIIHNSFLEEPLLNKVFVLFLFNASVFPLMYLKNIELQASFCCSNLQSYISVILQTAASQENCLNILKFFIVNSYYQSRYCGFGHPLINLISKCCDLYNNYSSLVQYYQLFLHLKHFKDFHYFNLHKAQIFFFQQILNKFLFHFQSLGFDQKFDFFVKGRFNLLDSYYQFNHIAYLLIYNQLFIEENILIMILVQRAFSQNSMVLFYSRIEINIIVNECTPFKIITLIRYIYFFPNQQIIYMDNIFQDKIQNLSLKFCILWNEQKIYFKIHSNYN